MEEGKYLYILDLSCNIEFGTQFLRPDKTFPKSLMVCCNHFEGQTHIYLQLLGQEFAANLP